MVNLRSLQIMQDNSTVLWGELEDSDSEKVNLNPTDRELLLRIPKPLSLEGPRIHQPKITDLKSQNYSYNLQESYVTHGVQLLSYINDLNKIKEAAINRREKGILPILGDQSIPPLPPLSPPNTVNHHRTPFMTFPQPRSISLNLPIIHSHQAAKSTKKAVAALVAFHGYDHSTDQALDVLSDATGQFLTKFCTLLRQARDKELSNNSKNGFPDIICRVFTEMGLGSILNISNYQNAIIAKHKSIGEAAETLAFECHHLDEVQNFPILENGSLLMEDHDVPEIHFPSSEEGDCGGSSGPPTLTLDHNAPQIETGLQMLQSLEQYGSLVEPGASMVTPPPASAHSGTEECEQPMSHDSNAALLLATVSPGSSGSNAAGLGGSRKRRKTSDNRNTVF